jgi:hypothetical protein
MIREANLSRRGLIATITGGSILGGIWATAFPALAMENRPTLALVGHRGAQLMVLDSSRARALILVGEPDDTLMSMLPAIMTVFRQRIDLMIGPGVVLAQHAGMLASRWSIERAITLGQAAPGEALAIPTTVLAGTIRLNLGAETTIVCRVGHRDEWKSDPPERASLFWTLTISHPGGAVTIAPDPLSLEVAAAPPATLLISPDIPPEEAVRRAPAEAFACNYDTDTIDRAGDTGKPLTRVYPEDIARFVFDASGIRLPPWTALS